MVRLSTLIRKLQKIQKEHGDLPVVVWHCGRDNGFTRPKVSVFADTVVIDYVDWTDLDKK